MSKHLSNIKLVMTLVCRDEADIILQNIDTHLSLGVDHVLVTDHGSVDGTRDILAEYERLGVATVIDKAQRKQTQSKWMTRMAKLAKKRHGAEWILNNDADEFWIPESGNLKDAVQGATASVLQARRMNMVYAHDTDPTLPWAERLVYRAARPLPLPTLQDFYSDTLEFPYFYHELPPKVLTRAKGLLRIHPGNHAASYRIPVEHEASDINIFHFPVRSPEQFTRKVVAGTEALLLNRHLPPRQGWHLRRWYRIVQNRGIPCALADALPDHKTLIQHVQNGMIVEDRTVQDIIHRRETAFKAMA